MRCKMDELTFMCSHGSYDSAEAGLNQTLRDLGLEYLDLYLMHWPVGSSSNENKLDYIKVLR
jgi:alcohol dehydrogenase (NADP+)